MSSQPNMTDKPFERDPLSMRRASQLNLLLPIASRWVDVLPVEIQPRTLLKQFPRIANIVARSWDDRDSVERYLSDLLIDRRGGRRGFPPDVQLELLTLREYVAGFSGVARSPGRRRQQP